jgi:hypothetical protein
MHQQKGGISGLLFLELTDVYDFVLVCEFQLSLLQKHSGHKHTAVSTTPRGT